MNFPVTPNIGRNISDLLPLRRAVLYSAYECSDCDCCVCGWWWIYNAWYICCLLGNSRPRWLNGNIFCHILGCCICISIYNIFLIGKFQIAALLIPFRKWWTNFLTCSEMSRGQGTSIVKGHRQQSNGWRWSQMTLGFSIRLTVGQMAFCHLHHCFCENKKFGNSDCSEIWNRYSDRYVIHYFNLITCLTC